MNLLSFKGRLTAFAGDARENDPFTKFTIKTREESTMHGLLSAFLDKDEGIEDAYKWANSPGYGKATATLTNALKVQMEFDTYEFPATLVSIAMTKKATADIGTIVEYAFNLEKNPADEDTVFWTAYLKRKENPEELEPDLLGRMPKPKPLEYHVSFSVDAEPVALPAGESENPD